MKDEFPYIAKDIAKMLGHNATKNMTRTLDEKFMKIKVIETAGGPQSLKHLSIDGVVQAISQSRKLSSSEKEKLFKQFINETVVYVGGAKEIEFLTMLEKQLLVFGITGFSRQHTVNGKRIDLYLPQVNVAIEYD